MIVFYKHVNKIILKWQNFYMNKVEILNKNYKINKHHLDMLYIHKIWNL